MLEIPWKHGFLNTTLQILGNVGKSSDKFVYEYKEMLLPNMKHWLL